MLFGVNNVDPATFFLTSAFLAVVVLAASLGPARSAVHVDPLTALRDE
jgi:ABC-type lipoprotein release transport system permease subunit